MGEMLWQEVRKMIRVSIFAPDRAIRIKYSNDEELDEIFKALGTLENVDIQKRGYR